MWCDCNGLPLHVLVTGANAHDSTMLAPLLDTDPGVREHGGPGRPRRRPGKLHADKGWSDTWWELESHQGESFTGELMRKVW